MDMQRVERALEKLKRAVGIGMKRITMPHGIPGHSLTQVEREAPQEEPPAWPINDELSVVGKSVKRLDAHAKVTGSAKYTSDIRLPGMLFGKMLCSHHPHAKVISVDTTAAARHPGVAAVHLFGMTDSKDDRGQGEFPEITFAGQPIAGVAAQSLQIAEEAVKLIRVEYQKLPFVVDLEEAQKKSAPVAFHINVEEKFSDRGVKINGNRYGPWYGKQKGDVKRGFADADLVVERTYKTQVQHHCCLETHGVVVDYRDDGVTVYASTQSTKNVRDGFARTFGLPANRVRVICEFMGGGFGSKQQLGRTAVMAGYLSKKSGRPVSLMLDRKEEFLSAGNRSNSIQRLKIGARKDGTLTAVELHSRGTAGVGRSAGVGNVARSLYPCANFYSEHYTVLTNAGPAKPFRAPGNVQGAFPVEQLMDELAERLGLDPLVLRDRCDRSEIRRLERLRGAEKFGWSRRKVAGASSGTVKKGLGMAQATWPKMLNLDSTVEVLLFKDGGIEVRSGVQDIGTGTKTVLAQVVAEELGLQPEEITVRIGDTLFPDGPTSEGSKVTGSITPAARNAAYKVKRQLFEQVANTLGTEASELAAAEGRIFSKKEPSKKIAFQEALRMMKNTQIGATATRSENYEGKPVSEDLGSVQFAEVSVDTETGIVNVERIVTANSCGRPINIAQIESQIEGAVIQGVSYALYENRVMDAATGHQMNTNLHQYQLPFSMEIPEIEIILIESYDAATSTDAVGIGEPPIIATAPAIANAVYNAIGVRIYELPITPDKVLKALNKI
ncbi:xanthine dehydrogenase family protein molybdopterin-binding subunit [Sulfurimonas sp. HSL3-7]|uniref:xanthine dehydrogenase family protein molybdopterin-binding subunit n=1 Tax=Sulfonitrofixus jiaomeiensis TaxID=3131938 RepID=UPI0031F8AB92